MAESLTIYECPTCGHVIDRGGSPMPPVCNGLRRPHGMIVCRRVRVFREDDVRPLWEIANVYRREMDYLIQGDERPRRRERDALDKFPAPEDWR